MYHGFYTKWLPISLCAPTMGLYENSDAKIGILEKGDLTIEMTNHSQVIFT